MSSWQSYFSPSRIDRRQDGWRRSAKAIIQKLEIENSVLKKQLEELKIYRELAYQDHLTELRNRRYFDERLEQEIQRGGRHSAPVSIVLLDLDDFKRFNDEAGHEMGDRVLRRFGDLLKSCQRRFDVPCRVGGDEFALILPETDEAGARSVVDRLDDIRAEIPFSAGIATFPTDGRDAGSMVATADDRMFEAKRSRGVKRFAG